MEFLIEGIMALTWKQVVMYAVGIILIWLAIRKEYEPSLLLPMGFGAILVNLPMSGVLDQTLQGGIESHGIITWLFDVGIDASEAMPILAVYRNRRDDRLWSPVIQSGHVPVWSRRTVWYLCCDPGGSSSGLPASGTVLLSVSSAQQTARLPFWYPRSWIPTISGHRGGSLFLHGTGAHHPAFCYPPCDHEKRNACIHMEYNPKGVSKRMRIAFPIVVTAIVGLVAPQSVALVGFLMFGNLIRECGVLGTMSDTAQNQLANLITLLLGITISFSMQAENFVKIETIMIMVLGLFAFVMDTIGGVLFAKILNLFLKKKVTR